MNTINFTPPQPDPAATEQRERAEVERAARQALDNLALLQAFYKAQPGELRTAPEVAILAEGRAKDIHHWLNQLARDWKGTLKTCRAIQGLSETFFPVTAESYRAQLYSAICGRGSPYHEPYSTEWPVQYILELNVLLPALARARAWNKARLEAQKRKRPKHKRKAVRP